MIHTSLHRAMGRLGPILCFCLAVLLSAGSAQAQEGRLQPDGPPVEVATEADQASSSPHSSAEAGFDNNIREFYESGSNNLTALLVPIVAVAFIFGGPVVLVIVLAVLHYRSKRHRETLRAETIQRALEAGREIPSELINNGKSDAAKNYRNNGIKSLGLGLGLVVALSLLLGIQIGGIGFILVGIGASQLVLWKLDQNQPADAG